jgi:uncharacterized cupredoxin-like copper-binding protein
MRKLWWVLGSMAVASLAFTGCGDDDDDSADGEIGATLEDFEITLDEDSAPAGSVTFKVDNKGPSVHEFVVFKTDLAVEELPTDDVGDVAESDEFAPVDEIEDIAKGAKPSLTVDLDPGSYVIICNIAGHYRQGMRVAFTVA